MPRASARGGRPRAASRARVERLDDALRGALPALLATLRRATVRDEAALEPAVRRLIERGRDGLARDAARLGALSPLAVLARGYAIALDAGGRALVDARAVAVGDAVRVRLAAGEIAATVVSSQSSASSPDGVRDTSTPEEIQ